MEQDKAIDKNLYPRQKVAGYGIGNLLSDGNFIATHKNPTLSFRIYDILMIDSDEIMKLEFPKIKNAIVRLMKYTNDESQPVAVFDIINTETKQIVLTSDKEYIGGLGLEHFFYEAEMITQWEIPILSKLCRSFVMGDIETIKLLMNEYYLKFSDDNAVKLKNSLGIK